MSHHAAFLDEPLLVKWLAHYTRLTVKEGEKRYPLIYLSGVKHPWGALVHDPAQGGRERYVRGDTMCEAIANAKHVADTLVTRGG